MIFCWIPARSMTLTDWQHHGRGEKGPVRPLLLLGMVDHHIDRKGAYRPFWTFLGRKEKGPFNGPFLVGACSAISNRNPVIFPLLTEVMARYVPSISSNYGGD